MINFETWWNSSSADEFRRLNDDMDGRVVRPVWDAAIRATLSSQKATSAAPSPEAPQPTQAEAPSEREALQLAWDKCKAACDPSDWTVSESAAYRGFFAHGYRAALATQQAEQPCGHPESLLLKSAETGEPLYCEACDDKSGRRDAEARETELLAANRALRAELAALKQQAVQGEPVAWREHVEQRIRTWRQRTMNRSGDRLAIDDFMGQDSIDDLVDFVCDESATPPAPGQVERINLSTFAWGVTRMGDNPKAVLVSFRSEPTDDDLRALHEALRPASGRTVHANAAQAGQVERDREDAELLRRALYYLEADAAGRYGIQGLEEMVRAGDHPVVADLRKRLGGSARFPDVARSSEGEQA